MRDLTSCAVVLSWLVAGHLSSGTYRSLLHRILEPCLHRPLIRYDFLAAQEYSGHHRCHHVLGVGGFLVTPGVKRSHGVKMTYPWGQVQGWARRVRVKYHGKEICFYAVVFVV